jgi:hypothetical protein
MTKDEALDKALNALLWANIEINDWRYDGYGYKPEDQPQIMEAITAIKQALAAPVQEPSCKDCRIDKPCSAKGQDLDVCSFYVPPPAAPVQEPEYVYTCIGCGALYREDDTSCDCTVHGLMQFTRHILMPDTTAAPVQEPVAWIDMSQWPPIRWRDGLLRTDVDQFDGQGLYTSPPASKPWVGLDDTDLAVCDTDGVRLARYWERVLREKNT